VLAPELVGGLVLAFWAAALLGWIVGTYWEETGQTEARRREVEAERAARGRTPILHRAWAFASRSTLIVIPPLFAIDAFLLPLGLLYHPWLTYGGPFGMALQVLGMICALVALVIMFWLGRILAVRVYRRAAHERELLQTGPYAYIRHPLYLHFFLLPIGLLLLTLNWLMLVVLLAYLTIDGPSWPWDWMREEEEELLERHGSTYADYMARTGRLLPRLRR
jgi:protein-S-isoprenylcysteine O-methyltransferase Ste14